MNRFVFVFNRLCSQAEENPAVDSRLGKHWLVLILGIIVAICTALALGQDCTWDVMNYHFYSGYALVAKPLNYDFAPAQVQSFFNPLQHVLSYFLLAHLPSITAAIILAAIQGVNFYLVFQISQSFFRKWPDPFRFLICILNAATGCYSSSFILELGTTFGDNLTSLLILTGILLIIHYLALLEDAASPSIVRIAIAGAILGVALGIKLTVAIYLAAIAVAMSSILLFWGRRIRPLIIFFFFMAVGFIAVYGFWGYSLYHEYQNPIFPYMNSIFRSPFFDPVNAGDARFFSRTWQQRFFYPFFFTQKNSLVSEMPFRDIRMALCYVAVVVLGLFGLARYFRNLVRFGEKPSQRNKANRLLQFCVIFFVITYILWQNQFSIYRYLIVLELLAPTFLAVVIAYFTNKRAHAFLGSILVNGLICAFMIPADFGRQKFEDDFLKAEIPIFENLNKSVVIMSGGDGTSFIVPRFPPETRFIRISSNFYGPGQNLHLDNKIRKILSQYDTRHTLAFISEEQKMEAVRKELSFYGVMIDEQSCRPVLRRAGDVGYLCATSTDQMAVPKAAVQDPSAEPMFSEIGDVRLEIHPAVADSRDTIRLHLLGQKYSAIDLLYTVNGELQPPQKRVFLDSHQYASFPVSSRSLVGIYHFIGIRNSASLSSDPWIKVSARLLIR